MRKDQIFLLACLGYIGGVFLGSFFVSPQWILLCGIALWVGVCVAFPSRRSFLFIVPIFFFIAGTFLVERALDRYRGDDSVSQEIIGTVRVVSEPEEKTFFRQVIVRGIVCEQDDCPKEKILWQAPLSTDVSIGSRLTFSCLLERPENFDPAFDYRMFLAKNGIGYVCAHATISQSLPEDRHARMMRFFFLPKRAFERAIEQSLPQPEAGLALGLVIGGDNRLPENLKQAFVASGLSHITAISGYNIALIVQGLMLLGIGLGLWRRQALWFAVIGIILFIILVGAPSSAVRAGVMGVCALSGLFFGRLSRGLNMLFFAGGVMLIFQPLLLRYDIGFQLSFLATLALIFCTPIMQSFLPRIFFGKTFVEIAMMTFAVELFVVPIIAYQFHIFSPFALLMNVLILPLIPYTMALTSISALGFFLLPGLHIIPAGITYALLRTITSSVEYLSGIAGAVQSVSLSPLTLFLWYVVLFSGIVVGEKYFVHTYVEKNTSE
ncbi:MAG: ComEC/Rec2 family competence protein [Candidatus Moranbacteria bacterium]|nr:ComEC/Rec2 family competence protein [Candidatus Moranbacteria bacterium]MDD3965409.1 ComEC/Rec2 family competence protein [Candidatus Moranbacteria bacterium]